MKKNLRAWVLLLSLICVLPMLFTACSGDGDGASVTTAPPVNGDPAKPNYDVTGGGRDVIVLSREADSYLFAYDEVDVLVEEGSDDRVSAAVYSRDQHLNELFDINIVSSKMTREKMRNEVEKCHIGGIQTYDFIMGMVEDSFGLSIQGYLREWGRIPYVDLSQDHWNSNFYHATTVGGFNFYCPGSANLSVYNTVGVTFFNKDLRTKYSLEDPYQLVKDGLWTVEKMMEMCAEVTGDTDGLTGMTYQDTYGLAVNSFVWQPFFYSSGYFMVEKDENDIPYLSATNAGMSEVVINLLSTVTSMVNNPDLAILTNREEYKDAVYSAANLETDIFVGNRALFWVENIYGQNNLREMENYGILPMPKWNTAAGHVSYTHAGHSSVMSVPLTSPDLKLAGAVMEEMASYSERVVIPEFYEQTVRIRGTRDAESYEMLDIVYETVVIDLAVVMKYSGLGLDTAIRGMLNFNDTGYATMFGSQGGGYRTKIDDLVTKFATQAAKQYE